MSNTVSRRIFIAGAGSLAASSALAAPNDRVSVGMIGVGSRAHQLMESIKQVNGAEMVGVFDCYKGRIERAVERAEGRAKAYKSYQAILSDPSIDSVVIASPDHWHARQCIEALEAGKHVYCEKPLTYTIDEGVKIAAAVKKSGKVLQVGSQGVSSAAQNKAREMIREGAIGKVTMVRASYNRNSASGSWIYPIPPDASPETVDWKLFLGSAPKRPFDLERFFRWRCYRDYSGGIATDLFVHLCTTIHHLMDAKAPSEVIAMGDLYRWKESRDVPDTLNAMLRYREGFTVNLSSTFNNQYSAGSQFSFHGTEGTLSVGSRSVTLVRETGHDNNDWIIEGWPSKLEAEYRAQHPEENQWPKRQEPEQIRVEGGDSTTAHFENFFNSVRTGAPIIEDVWAGHRAAACAHLINSSARRGSLARWDFKKDRQLA